MATSVMIIGKVLTKKLANKFQIVNAVNKAWDIKGDILFTTKKLLLWKFLNNCLRTKKKIEEFQ